MSSEPAKVLFPADPHCPSLPREQAPTPTFTPAALDCHAASL